MRSIYLMGLVMVSLLFACEEQKVEIFNGGNAIYFDKFYTDAIYPGLESADSTVVSFFFYADDVREVQAPLLVNLMGGSLQTDLTFQLKVVEDATTANPDEYKLADQYVFEARPDSVYTNLIQEYFYIDLFKSDRLQNGEVESVCLVVELVPGEGVGLGQLERRKAKIILTTKTAVPTWWDQNVADNLLGQYTDTKYKTFLNAIEGASDIDEEMIQTQPDKVIQLVMRFKVWLAENPTMDEDGWTMEVVI